MKLQNQVCTLEQAKRLKELGVCQKAYFLWQWEENPNQHFLTYKGTCYPNCAVFEKDYAAFTVAELGVMLPRNFASFYCGLNIWRIANTFNYATNTELIQGRKYYIGTSKTFVNITTDNEASVRATLLIYLLESSQI